MLLGTACPGASVVGTRGIAVLGMVLSFPRATVGGVLAGFPRVFPGSTVGPASDESSIGLLDVTLGLEPFSEAKGLSSSAASAFPVNVVEASSFESDGVESVLPGGLEDAVAPSDSWVSSGVSVPLSPCSSSPGKIA